MVLRWGWKPEFIDRSLTVQVGTTSSSAIDPLPALADIAKRRECGMWFHVDAAYAGNACICPEFRHFLNGVENAHSFNLSANKWLLTNIDCSILWLKWDTLFQSLKLWFVMRLYGASGLRSHIRTHINHAKHFEILVPEDSRFELPVLAPCRFGLVCFRLKPNTRRDLCEDNGWKLNCLLLETVNSGGKIFMTHTVRSSQAIVKWDYNRFILRYSRACIH
ncbi:tyrosine decarboxylase 1-like [Selaginella moellendorffii]|uniref:tyrosine decarboxylase 1-like n=1 Tax=Selaginella moellendorffii TaxID=88036 RepID=UPI000D1C3845|nr:tyrosine decarboxylase 1-like [Selaginella moellendorffii]|eukprot:XP_024545884.1 tyrosine decarboxylase 1-like [Selaginella moellendorffii]